MVYGWENAVSTMRERSRCKVVMRKQGVPRWQWWRLEAVELQNLAGSQCGCQSCSLLILRTQISNNTFGSAHINFTLISISFWRGMRETNSNVVPNFPNRFWSATYFNFAPDLLLMVAYESIKRFDPCLKSSAQPSYPSNQFIRHYLALCHHKFISSRIVSQSMGVETKHQCPAASF